MAPTEFWYHLQGDPGGVYLLHQGKLVLVLVLVLGQGRVITSITRFWYGCIQGRQLAFC